MIRRTGLLLASICFLTAVGQAQQPAAAPPNPALAIGRPAPDFSLVGATRYGVLRDRIRLSDFHGKTVVLAFFYQARTKG